MKKTLVAISGALVLTMASQANAGLITSAPGGTVIDFSQYDTGSYTRDSGPTDVGVLVGETVTYTAVGSRPGFGGGSYGLLANGSWTDPLGAGSGRDGFAFIDNGGISMTFTFVKALTSVGAFINYCPSCSPSPATVEALDINGLVLETYNLETLAPISTPNQTDAGAFRGISRTQGDIFGLRFANRLVVADDLEFVFANGSQVPVPATAALLALGLAGVGFKRKKSRA